MKQAAADTTTRFIRSRHLTAGSVGLQLLDTTWRIAVPVLLFTCLGIFIDLHIGTKPWLTFLGVVIGFVFAALLVKRQIEAIEKEENRK